MKKFFSVPLVVLSVLPLVSFFCYSPLFVWGLLEFFNIFFIYFFLKKKVAKWTVLIFFLVQCVCSVLVLWGIVSNVHLTLVLALLVKMGLFPFYGWLVLILPYSSFRVMSVLLINAKLIPLVFLLKLPGAGIMLNLGVGLTFVVFTGLVYFYSNIKLFIFYSSGINTAIFLVLKNFNLSHSVVFCVVYFFLLYNVLDSLDKESPGVLGGSPTVSGGYLVVLMLSLSGLPLSLGFLAKWVVLSNLFLLNNFLFFMVLMGSFCVMSFFYVNIVVSYFYLKDIMVSFSIPQGLFFKKNLLFIFFYFAVYVVFLGAASAVVK